jgi:carboxymethylenebutenolidase
MGKMIEIAASQVLPAYIAIPEGQPKGGVLVIHEVWGLTDHIKSVADRVAAAGYVALAPDLLSAANIDLGQLRGMQEGLFDPERRNQVQPQLRQLMAPIQSPEFGAATAARLQRCFDHLYNMPEARRAVGVLGFCFGGTYSFTLATHEPRLVGAIPYYGDADQDIDELKRITCPVLAFYGERDEALVSKLPELVANMQTAGVVFQGKVYPDCGHAFFNDTNAYAYNEAAATDAWILTLAFLERVMSNEP